MNGDKRMRMDGSESPTEVMVLDKLNVTGKN